MCVMLGQGGLECCSKILRTALATSSSASASRAMSEPVGGSLLLSGAFPRDTAEMPIPCPGLLLVWALLAVDPFWLDIPAAVITGCVSAAWELVQSASLPAFAKGMVRAQRPLWTHSCTDALHMLEAEMHIIAIWGGRVFWAPYQSPAPCSCVHWQIFYATLQEVCTCRG